MKEVKYKKILKNNTKKYYRLYSKIFKDILY